MPYVIKRYSNRKLYDVQQSRYVTLEALERMIGEGKEISVVDARTGDDLTSITLIQILLERERTRRGALASTLLHQMIKYGETWQDLLQKSLRSSLEGIVSAQPEQDRIVKTWTTMVGLTAREVPGSSGEKRPSAAEEVESLRSQIAVLREKLSQLEQKLAGRE